MYYILNQQQTQWLCVKSEGERERKIERERDQTSYPVTREQSTLERSDKPAKPLLSNSIIKLESPATWTRLISYATTPVDSENFPRYFSRHFFVACFFFQKRKTLPFLLFQEILRDDFLTWSIDFRLLGNLSLGIGGDDSRYVENDQHRVERSHFQRWRHQSVRAVNQVHQTSPSSSSSSSSSSHAPPQSRIRTVFLLIEFFFLSLFFSPIHRHFHFDGRNVAIKNDLMKSS